MIREGQIYILPTRFGLVFTTGAIIMILIGAGYQNNLVNLLAYFMLSLVFIGMIQTHNNLKDIKVESIEAEGGFKGTEFVVTTALKNESQAPRFNLEAGFKKLATKAVYENNLPLLANGTLKLRATYPARKRGRHRLESVRLATVYPLGLFRAWLWLPIEKDYFIYPEPVGNRELPFEGQEEDLEHSSHSKSGSDFHGHRKYQPGDSPRHIDWKAHARGRPMMIKQFTEGSSTCVQIDWSLLEGLETEARLSQMAAWVNEAQRRKLPFALHMPGAVIPRSEGLQHATRCLEALAAFDEEAAS
jgi:uncharacterized protein (DUF58 family)